MSAINTSIFEFLKIGPGPSSSHTIGPMAAGYDFVRLAHGLDREDIKKAAKVEVHLYGSLSATGKGHGTDRAVVAGLMGNSPEECEAATLDKLAADEDEKQRVRIGKKEFELSVSDVVFDRVDAEFPFANTLVIRLVADDGRVILEREYYSVGGGFIQWKGWQAPEKGQPEFLYHNMGELEKLVMDNRLPMHEIILRNEMAISGISEKQVWDGVEKIMDAMDASVTNGLDVIGLLPGPLQVRRKAVRLYESAGNREQGKGRFMALMNAFAFAASEENAAGHRIVTAPTCGAAGVIPATLKTLRDIMGIGHYHLREALLVACAVGFICKHNASIAGADVGCQGEVGVATSMAAALVAYAKGAGGMLASHAAEIGLEHQLGLTCDPVGGYVQIPCIERNAMGAVKAYNAALIATSETAMFHKVTLDMTVKAMAETGKDMSCKYKETSMGGLAVCMVNC